MTALLTTIVIHVTGCTGSTSETTLLDDQSDSRAAAGTVEVQKIQQQENSPIVIEYDAGQPPGDEPVIFKPGIVSTDEMEFAFSIAPDGTEMLFSREETIYLMRKKKDGTGWTVPFPAPFSGKYIDGEASYAPDKMQIIFNSRRPLPGAAIALSLWYVEHGDDGWLEPQPFKSPVNDQVMHAACISNYGNLYASGLIKVPYKDEIFCPAEKLIPDIKGYGPYVDPEERFILFSNSPARGVLHDLYIALKQADGTWSDPIRLNDKINTSGKETNPTLSPDGKYMFFGRNEDIYWVSTAWLDPLLAE